MLHALFRHLGLQVGLKTVFPKSLNIGRRPE